MTETQTSEREKRLRAQGLTVRQIAAKLGVAHSTVVKALNPDAAKEWNRCDNARRQPAKNAWARAQRAKLSDTKEAG